LKGNLAVSVSAVSVNEFQRHNNWLFINQPKLKRRYSMKKFVILTLVLVLLAVSVVPAYAASRTRDQNGAGNKIQVKPHGKMPFALAGTIASIDPVARTITVTVACGNKVVQPYIGRIWPSRLRMPPAFYCAIPMAQLHRLPSKIWLSAKM
jgi:heme/copper-type cytochrome/quinol oxidase subunit 2